MKYVLNAALQRKQAICTESPLLNSRTGSIGFKCDHVNVPAVEPLEKEAAINVVKTGGGCCLRGIMPAQSDDFSIRKFSSTKASISLVEKV
jgi:hypothetical protein